MSERRGHGPGVRVAPPTFFVAGFLIAWLLETWVFDLLPPLNEPTTLLGAFMIGLGLSFALFGIATFRNARTPIYPNRDASRLVTNGPYKVSRNPMYTGMVSAYIGVALTMAVGWALVLLPLVLLVIVRYVIGREERYLTEAFGDEYIAYQRRVRRWL